MAHNLTSAHGASGGRDAEFWLDSRKVHVFDPESGDNLTRDADAGAELTRLATQDRVEQMEDAQGRDGDAGRHSEVGQGSSTRT